MASAMEMYLALAEMLGEVLPEGACPPVSTFAVAGKIKNATVKANDAICPTNR
jgi:hypothetical protein